MLKKFLTDVILSIVGKPGEGLVELLYSKKHVNEFIIAKKLDFTINQTRNLLYKISDQGLVSFIRKKDKKKGWYTYFWKIEVLKSLKFLENILLKNIGNIKHQLKSRQEKQFYVCNRCSIEITEEHALLRDFICDECGEVYSLKDNTLVVRDLERTKSKFEKELKLVQEEIQKEEERLSKIKTRVLKGIEDEKIRVRKAKRKATQDLKKTLIKKKAPVKKKTPVKKSITKKKSTTAKKPVKKKSPTKKIPAHRSVYTQRGHKNLSRGPKLRNEGAKKSTTAKKPIAKKKQVKKK